MSELQTINMSAETIQRVMLGGDLSTLSPDQKLNYYDNVCSSLGLNPLTKPFEFIKLNGKEVLYAAKSCTEQLRNIHGISLKIVSREKIEETYVVTAQALLPNGRCDESTGAVSIKGLAGENLANAMMKAETKAKRRVTLSISGLSMMDDSEQGEWIDQTNEVKRPPTEHVKDMVEFASENELVKFEALLNIAGELLTEKEAAWYEKRIELSRRSVPSEKKGNAAVVHAFTPTNISYEYKELEKLIQERRSTVVESKAIEATVSAGDDELGELVAITAHEKYGELMRSAKDKVELLIEQIQSGEEVPLKTALTAISWCKEKLK